MGRIAEIQRRHLEQIMGSGKSTHQLDQWGWLGQAKLTPVRPSCLTSLSHATLRHVYYCVTYD